MAGELKPGTKVEACADVDFLYEAMYNRDPKKRRVKPVDHHLLQLDFGPSDNESDSDFEISDADSAAEMDDDLGSDQVDDYSNDEDGSDEMDHSGAESEKTTTNGETITKADQNDAEQKDEHGNTPSSKIKMLICAVCLGEVSIDSDEIVECDNCGIGVHEGCYGEIQSDNDSTSSVQTASSTEPWFCDTCKAGVNNPSCELCPNPGGIFKETDAGRWVHVVCALYVPGVAFTDVAKLRWVTLSEMPTGKWGVRTCVYCEDERFSRTGVCISCDAGMCRNYFHVSCGQREGFLSEACPEEDIADPFYAYCKLHVEKNSMRYRRQNYLAIQSQMKGFEERKPDDPIGYGRIAAKLKRWQESYTVSKFKKPIPWVPPEKIPRLLTTSPSALRHLMKKAELLGINTESPHQTAAKGSGNVRRKWHIPPAFTSEFVNYYLDRDVRMNGLKNRLGESLKSNDRLQVEQQALRTLYDRLSSEVEALRTCSEKQTLKADSFSKILTSLGLKKKAIPELLKKSSEPKPDPDGSEEVSTPDVIRTCGICEESTDQHLLVSCDTCRNHYHLGCLNPPLTRMPKKTPFSGWQCSQCVGSSSDTSMTETLEPDDGDQSGVKRKRRVIREPVKFTPATTPTDLKKVIVKKKKKVGKSLKRKATVVKVTDTPGEDVNVRTELDPPKAKRTLNVGTIQRRVPSRDARALGVCCKCNTDGHYYNFVICDQCMKGYHFLCLNPPTKKCPRRFGYMWYCPDCDLGSSTDKTDDDNQDDEPAPPSARQAPPSTRQTRAKALSKAKETTPTTKPSKAAANSTSKTTQKEAKTSHESPAKNVSTRSGKTTMSPRGTNHNLNEKDAISNGKNPSVNEMISSPTRASASRRNATANGKNSSPNGKNSSLNGTNSKEDVSCSLEISLDRIKASGGKKPGVSKK